MKLADLGYNDKLEEFRITNKLESFETGRVIAEHKERYIVKTVKGEFDAEITGNMRFTAKNRLDFPAVGDWVAMTTFDPDFAIIHHIFPRYSLIKRQAVGQFAEVQLIAANIDYAFLMQAVDRDYNINRLERYLAICHSSKVEPVIILSKTDLKDELQVNEITEKINSRIKGVPVLAISNETLDGYEEIKSFIRRGKTYCMLGSSGVGKSTLINKLSGQDLMKTGAISMGNSKGRHVTSHRELIILANGGIFVDNPGMREVGIADSSDGLEITFDRIISLAQNCKFKDCTHTNEIGCSVLDALENEELDKASYENYLKMEKEKAFFESSLVQRRKKEKEFGKIMKNYKKDKKKGDL